MLPAELAAEILPREEPLAQQKPNMVRVRIASADGVTEQEMEIAYEELEAIYEARGDESLMKEWDDDGTLVVRPMTTVEVAASQHDWRLPSAIDGAQIVRMGDLMQLTTGRTPHRSNAPRRLRPRIQHFVVAGTRRNSRTTTDRRGRTDDLSERMDALGELDDAFHDDVALVLGRDLDDAIVVRHRRQPPNPLLPRREFQRRFLGWLRRWQRDVGGLVECARRRRSRCA